jgi:hypothetical protein
MCVNAVNIEQYQELMRGFEEDIYPGLHQSLNQMSASASLSEDLNTVITSLQKELRSLETFERKLIFPAVRSIIYNDDRADGFDHDIEAVIILTNMKDERLADSVEKLSLLLERYQKPAAVDGNDALIIRESRELMHIFSDQFFPQKEAWIALLKQLEHSGHWSNGINTDTEN